MVGQSNRDRARHAGRAAYFVIPVVLLSLAAAAAPRAQTPAVQIPAGSGPAPVFDVVTVRQNNTPAGPRGIRWSTAGRVEVRGSTVRELVRFAYDPSQYELPQVVDGPEWLDAQRFDIDAAGTVRLPMPDSNTNTPPQVLLAMMRGMLESRFKLVAREDVREIEHFALTRARPDALGPALTVRETCRPSIPGVAPDETMCNLITAGPGFLVGRAASVDRLAQLLTSSFPSIGKLVRNETGLTGIYDMNVSYVPDFISALPGGKPVPNPNAGSGLTIVQALDQQLGLKLEARRAPLDVIVVESAVMP